MQLHSSAISRILTTTKVSLPLDVAGAALFAYMFSSDIFVRSFCLILMLLCFGLVFGCYCTTLFYTFAVIIK